MTAKESCSAHRRNRSAQSAVSTLACWLLDVSFSFAAMAALFSLATAAHAAELQKRGEVAIDGAQIELAEVDGERLWAFRELPPAEAFRFDEGF